MREHFAVTSWFSLTIKDEGSGWGVRREVRQCRRQVGGAEAVQGEAGLWATWGTSGGEEGEGGSLSLDWSG